VLREETTMTTVRALMTPAPHTIGIRQTIEEATRRMRQAHIRHLPVLAGGRLVGMLSDRDARLVEALDVPERVRVEEVMSPDPFAVAPEDDLKRVVEIMVDRKLGSAVVLEEERVVGIFTTTDALQSLLRHLSYEALQGF
jgi:acetoin utilization protein AcuB